MSDTSGFVHLNGSGELALRGAPYGFVGANLWYGGALGSPGSGGDRHRLTRELDRLSRLGVTNLRVMAGSEGPNDQPWRVLPALQPAPGQYDREQWLGLDYLLAEMAKRDMKAVVCLSNMWQWSGGFAAYVSWVDGTDIPYPGSSTDSQIWQQFEQYSARFYAMPQARELYLNHLRTTLSRVNQVNGVAYRDDPTIMAWQLANEPRGVDNAEAYVDWVKQSTQLLKELDPRHLVSVGSEGTTPWSTANTCFEQVHALSTVDYTTCHVWVQNWQWFDPSTGLEGMRAAFNAHVIPYLDEHESLARSLGKSLVVEEFGISRDAGAYEPDANATVRDEYYRMLFEEIAQRRSAGSPTCGANFWAWSGEARPSAPGCEWKQGHAFTGDPPHEPQGWYGVYDDDEGTLRVLQQAASQMREPAKT